MTLEITIIINGVEANPQAQYLGIHRQGSKIGLCIHRVKPYLIFTFISSIHSVGGHKTFFWYSFLFLSWLSPLSPQHNCCHK